MDGKRMGLILSFSFSFSLSAVAFAIASGSAAYPSGFDFDSGVCGTTVEGGSAGGRRIMDISHAIKEDMPSWDSADGLGSFLWLALSMRNGSLANNSVMKLPTHTGTHVDSPAHVFQEYHDAGYDVDTLDLHTLNGPALLVDVPRDKNITACSNYKFCKHSLMCCLRNLMLKREFDTSYVGFMKDGAQWLVDNTDIKLDIILVEGLKLDNVKPGIYSLHCLHLRLIGAEGSPIRCILIE
ncbi:hypothetical protein AMTRI_Chr13g121140 [Amborella trichopoda]